MGGGNPDQAAFARLRAQLAASERLIVATGIASVWAWEPAELRAAAEALRPISPAGSSSASVSATRLPVQHSDTIIGARSRIRRSSSTSLTIRRITARSSALPPVVLAALGPKMLELARDQALGSHPYFTTPEHTRFAREVLGPAPLLVPELAFTLANDPRRARPRPAPTPAAM